jgi:hypothetical protein
VDAIRETGLLRGPTELVVGGDQCCADGFRAGEVETVIHGMIEQKGELERPLIEEGRWIEQRRAPVNPPREIRGLALADLADPTLLPCDIGNFRSEQIGA